MSILYGHELGSFAVYEKAYKKGDFQQVGRMAGTVFRVQSHKFSQDNIQTTLVCSKCDEIFSKEFLLDLEGQTIEFKCPVCGAPGEADLPYKSAAERQEFEEDFEDTEEEEGAEEFEEDYQSLNRRVVNETLDKIPIIYTN